MGSQEFDPFMLTIGGSGQHVCSILDNCRVAHLDSIRLRPTRIASNKSRVEMGPIESLCAKQYRIRLHL
jgi:hypothetical protein